MVSALAECPFGEPCEVDWKLRGFYLEGLFGVFGDAGWFDGVLPQRLKRIYFPFDLRHPFDFAQGGL